MKRNKYNELAIVNGKAAERRIDLINERGKRAITPEEESARARKAIHLLLTMMAQQHPEIRELAEYREAMEWYHEYETIKADVSKELEF